MEHGGVRVSEHGDELMRVNLRLDSAERGVAALMGKRGAHWKGARFSDGWGGQERGSAYPVRDIRRRELVRARTCVVPL